MTTKKPNKPWRDRKKKQILEGKLMNNTENKDLEKEIALWENKQEVKQ